MTSVMSPGLTIPQTESGESGDNSTPYAEVAGKIGAKPAKHSELGVPANPVAARNVMASDASSTSPDLESGPLPRCFCCHAATC